MQYHSVGNGRIARASGGRANPHLDEAHRVDANNASFTEQDKADLLALPRALDVNFGIEHPKLPCVAMAGSLACDGVVTNRRLPQRRDGRREGLVRLTRTRLISALACYAALGVIAALVLDDKRFVAAVVVLLLGLAVMSVTAYLRERLSDE